MLRNYLKIALRNLRKRPGYTFINVAGLAVGLACCLMIALYVRHEVSYDAFHENADDVYRIAWFSENPQTRTPHPMALAMVQDLPVVHAGTSLTPLWGPGLTRPTYALRYEDHHFEERDILAVDSTFFDVFSFPVLQGDARAALRVPGQILFTRSAADRYFGDEDPLGKRIVVNGDTELTVGAVLEDVPANAHFHFDFLVSYVTLKQQNPNSAYFTWDDFGHYNYIRLAEGADPATLQAQLPAWSARYIDFQEETLRAMAEGRLGLRLQRLTDIHLHSNIRWELEPNSDATYVYAFSAAALLILLIACINFMNLATARSMERAREVGVRKAVGAERRQLIAQFLGESLLLSGAAGVAALALTEMLLPLFNTLAGTDLALMDVGGGRLILGLLGVVLGTGLVAGSYPAFYLSSFRPVQVLKGKPRAGRGEAAFRKGLVVFQFAITITLITGTLVVHRQLDYLTSRPLGFDQEQVVVLSMKDEAMRERYEAVKEAIGQHPGVRSATAVSNVPGGRFNQNPIQWQEDVAPQSVAELRADHDFLQTLGVALAAGRDFSRASPTDMGESFLLNEAAARLFDWETPVGEEITWYDDETTRQGRVVGVMEDFHFASLHQQVGPLIVQILPGAFNYLLVRLRPGDVAGTLAFLEQQWAAFAPGRGFEYSFLSQDFDALYRVEARTRTLAGSFAVLAVLIACLGLFGLAAFLAEQRTKEIGVRKVLGASTAGIVGLFSKDFLGLVLVAFVMAAPLAYLGMRRWLDGFAYRIDLDLGLIALAGGLALAIALLTVSYQAVKAARKDPVESLRYE